MQAEVDFFVLYRWSVATVCTIYTLVVMVRAVLRWLAWSGSSRQAAMVGRYTSVLLLRTRLRQFGWDLCQIAVLLVLLGVAIYLHRYLPASA